MPILLSFAFILAQQTPAFAPPVQIHAGDKVLGVSRMYPSPEFHDVNHDGILDAIIGDLPGRVTVAYGKKGQPLTFEKEVPLKATDGKQLDFGNW